MKTKTTLLPLVYETAPVSMRGPLGGITQLSIFTGTLVCFTLGFGTPDTHEQMISSQYWRFMFALPALVAIIQTSLLLTLFKYETPIYSLVV
jgi:multisubunit Na+/H+ antiporter MnhB subunit